MQGKVGKGMRSVKSEETAAPADGVRVSQILCGLVLDPGPQGLAQILNDGGFVESGIARDPKLDALVDSLADNGAPNRPSIVVQF